MQLTASTVRLQLAAAAPLDGFSAVKVRFHLPEPGSPSASPPCVPSSLLRSSVALTESNVAQSTQSSYDNRSTCAHIMDVHVRTLQMGIGFPRLGGLLAPEPVSLLTRHNVSSR